MLEGIRARRNVDYERETDLYVLARGHLISTIQIRPGTVSHDADLP